MRGRPEGNLDHGVNAEKGNLGLIRRAPDLIVGNDALGRQDHPIGRHGEIDVHELQPVDLGVAEGIATLDVNERNVRIERGDEQQFLAGERAVELLRFRALLEDIGAQHRADRQEGDAHAASAKAHAHRHVAPFLEALAAFFDMVAHHLGEAPENPLREPAGDDFVGHIGAEQEIAVGRNDAARAGEMLAPLAHQLPQHRHWRARHGRAADANRHSVLHKGRRVVQRHDFLAQAAIAPGEALPERLIVSHKRRRHPFLLRADKMGGPSDAILGINYHTDIRMTIQYAPALNPA